jgi:hypothetical protein
MLRVVICEPASDLKESVDEWGTDLDISSGAEIEVIALMFIHLNVPSEAETDQEC